MKFSAIAVVLALAGVSLATTDPCLNPRYIYTCRKRSIAFTSKPREWINAVRSAYAEAPVEAAQVQQ